MQSRGGLPVIKRLAEVVLWLPDDREKPKWDFLPQSPDTKESPQGPIY